MTTLDIALEYAQADQKLFRLMTKRVAAALQTQREDGAVRSKQATVAD